MTPEAAERIERKVDGLVEAVKALVLIEERQKQDWRRMDAFDKRLADLKAQADATDQLLQKWINRGIGAWALAATVAAAFKYLPLKGL